MASDHYEEYYASKLWAMVPAIYRAEDSEPLPPGPLREIVNRIGVQAAVLRRSIDRLWEDQSIETCDDWLVPYIGDLLATRLVAPIDARAQRIDVAKTIYYRRRKGTVGLLEELASDISGRDVRVVEFFRRLGRTRHLFDPPIGLVARPSANGVLSGAKPLAPTPLAIAGGLSGLYSGTPAGGFADLRHRYGAAKAGSAFDEYSYTADFRRGRQGTGWHDIPHLGAFAWWLSTLPVPATTPVACDETHFSFDPLGRKVPLFATTRRRGSRFGDAWASPEEWQLPVRISRQLFELRTAELYPDALSIFEGETAPYVLLPPDRVTVDPEHGTFKLTGAQPAGGQVYVRYHYGFVSEIGAGAYDQLRGLGAAALSEPVVSVSGGGGSAGAPLTGLGGAGTLKLADSLTYDRLPDTGRIGKLAIVGRNLQRPVVRATGDTRPVWVIEGGGETAELLLQGIHLAGMDILLTGAFESVRIRCATLDPGTAGSAKAQRQLNDPAQVPGLFATAVDGQKLWPTRLFIEASINRMSIERSITGPIRVRAGGAVETLCISDSIVQALPETEGAGFEATAIYDGDALVRRIVNSSDPLAVYLKAALPAAAQPLIDNHAAGTPPEPALLDQLAGLLNGQLAVPLFTPERFACVPLSESVRNAPALPQDAAGLARRNRKLLTEAFQTELADLALATTTGQVQLVRSTILGPCAVHRLEASECILDEVVIAVDAQHGCVRFSAYAQGSRVHRPYESVAVAARAPLFETRHFGDPNYARLSTAADDAILSGRAGASIVTGAENGSEMGAFERELMPLRRRGLEQKFAEFMPIGLAPVWVDAS